MNEPLAMTFFADRMTYAKFCFAWGNRDTCWALTRMRNAVVTSSHSWVGALIDLTAVARAELEVFAVAESSYVLAIWSHAVIYTSVERGSSPRLCHPGNNLRS